MDSNLKRVYALRLPVVRRQVLEIIFFNVMTAAFLLSSAFSRLDLFFVYFFQSLIVWIFFCLRIILAKDKKIVITENMVMSKTRAFFSAIAALLLVHLFAIANLLTTFNPSAEPLSYLSAFGFSEFLLAIDLRFVLIGAAIFFALQLFDLLMEIARKGKVESKGMGQKLDWTFIPAWTFILIGVYFIPADTPDFLWLLLIALKAAAEIAIVVERS